VDGKPRNTKLTKSLEIHPFFAKSRILDAITPDTLNQAVLRGSIEKAQILLGRDVTATEICIAFTHQTAYQTAIAQNSDFALVIEDDVEIKDIESFANLIGQISESKKPTIWTFYSPNWSLWKIRKGKVKAIFPPAFAACYVINRSAIEIAVKSNPIGLADWPIWGKKIDFYLFVNSVIRIIDSHSFVETHRYVAKLKRHKLASICNPKFLFTVPINDRLRMIIFYPFLWKIHLGIRHIKYSSQKKRKR
jgi:GR25 family glycosyltransferase involved in LPS biosynthesis